MLDRRRKAVSGPFLKEAAYVVARQHFGNHALPRRRFRVPVEVVRQCHGCHVLWVMLRSLHGACVERSILEYQNVRVLVPSVLCYVYLTLYGVGDAALHGIRWP